MSDTGLWVICQHDIYGAMSDMWTWLLRNYEWYVNMIATVLWVIYEHDWYGSMSDMWTWLIRVYEWYVKMSDSILWATGDYGWYVLWITVDYDWCGSANHTLAWFLWVYVNLIASGGRLMVKIYGNVWIISWGDYIGGVWVWVIVFQPYGVLRHCQHYFSYIAAVSFISGGNRSTRSKPPTCRKWLTNFITCCCIEYTAPEEDSNSQR